MLAILLLIASFTRLAIVAPLGGEPAAARAATQVNWYQFQFAANHPGFNPFETTLGAGTIGGLVQLWKSGGDPGSGYYLQGSPAVVRGLLYAGASGAPPGVFALDTTTGSLQWHYDVPTTSSPAVANGLVYFGGYITDYGVYALNASTGALVWKFSLSNLIYASPAIANGVVYLDSPDGNLYALTVC
jgi:hypothetical protein